MKRFTKIMTFATAIAAIALAFVRVQGHRSTKQITMKTATIQFQTIPIHKPKQHQYR